MVSPSAFSITADMSSKPIYKNVQAPPASSSQRLRDPFKKDGGRRRHTLVNMPPSEWVSQFIRIKDGDRGVAKPLTFEERKYLRRAYDTPSRNLLLFTSRQTEKSTTMANKQLASAGMNSMHTSLFVSPSAMQTTVYSKTRIDEIISISPVLQALTHTSLTMNILEKEFLTRSKIFLRYAFLNADRIRGLSVNDIYADEIQDLLPDVMPVIEETSSHFKGARKIYAGTPKTLDNNIEHYRSKNSTMSEWVIPCEHHGGNNPSSWHWNVLGVENIGKTGPICSKCKKRIYPEHPMAQWVEFRPGAEFECLRICRLMVPWFYKDPEKWREILHAMERYPTAQFMNEVMAISYDSGQKPITREELIAACNPRYRIDEDQVEEISRSHELYMGIDHGTGGPNSKTVVAIGGYVGTGDSFQIVWMKQFNGPLSEPSAQFPEFCRIINKFRIKYVGADYGLGFYPNKLLTDRFGPKRIHQFQYAATLTSKFVFKPQHGRFMVYRTPVMSDIFAALKKAQITLPHWDDFSTPYGDDILSIFSEYSNAQRMIKYDKPRNFTDDSFHAILFCFLASMLDHRRPDIIAPVQSSEYQEPVDMDDMFDEYELMAPISGPNHWG